jgi:L-ascorbate metabolism protein UlaG (beta-lactamase superfamily)
MATPGGGSPIVERLNAVEVAPGSLCFLGLGQVGVGIKGPGGVVYVDPYLTDYGGGEGRLERVFPPPVEPGDVTDAAHVLVTHAHADHFDPETLGPLAKASPEARFYGPHTCDFSGEAGIDAGRTSLAKAGEAFDAGGARVTPVPSAHTGLEESERGYPYLGYVIEWNGVTVYHAGDTVVYDGLIETLGGWRIDVMLVPINGRDYFRTARNIIGNTDFREAVELAEVLDVGLVIPTHYDLFAFNAANPGHFVDYLYRCNPARRHKLLRPGELYYHLK